MVSRAVKILSRLAALFLVLIAGCTAMEPADFANDGPRLVLEDYFTGHTRAWGLFEDRFGKVRRQFVVDMVGTRQGDDLILNETFTYNDGERDQRVWTIRKTAPDRYEGTAGDIIGTAQGRAAGNAINWAYRMDLKVGDGRWRVAFDDWMFLQRDGVLLNRAHVSRWGIEIGSLAIFFMKEGSPAAQALAGTAAMR